MNISEAFMLIADLADKDDAAPVNKHPGCWERAVGKWHISVNGHREPRKNAEGMEVPPFSAVLTFNGWPAGIIDPSGGVIAAGAVANEDTFIEALKTELTA